MSWNLHFLGLRYTGNIQPPIGGMAFQVISVDILASKVSTHFHVAGNAGGAKFLKIVTWSMIHLR